VVEAAGGLFAGLAVCLLVDVLFLLLLAEFFLKLPLLVAMASLYLLSDSY
jgi:hypothetical protein